jgi:hypothetical protein
VIHKTAKHLATAIIRREKESAAAPPLTPCTCGHKRHLHYGIRGGIAPLCSRCRCQRFEEAK